MFILSNYYNALKKQTQFNKKKTTTNTNLLFACLFCLNCFGRGICTAAGFS